MQITFVTRKFPNVECNLHCDVLHPSIVRVAILVLYCNGVFAIKAYGKTNTIVSGLRARHFQTSASMFFLNNKNKNKTLKNTKSPPCFSASKEYVKHLQVLQYSGRPTRYAGNLFSNRRTVQLCNFDAQTHCFFRH